MAPNTWPVYSRVAPFFFVSLGVLSLIVLALGIKYGEQLNNTPHLVYQRNWIPTTGTTQ